MRIAKPQTHQAAKTLPARLLATLIAFPSTGVVRVDSAQPQVSRSCVDAESQRRE